MKNYTPMPRLKFILLLSALFCFLLPPDAGAQSVKRQVIASTGSSGHVPGALIRQTAGQSYGTSSSDNKACTVLQGFQQPVIYKAGKDQASLLDNRLTLFPVPATIGFSLVSEETMDQISVTVSDITGKQIYSTKLNDTNSHYIQSDSWDGGIYFLTITDQYGIAKTLKLMITK